MHSKRKKREEMSKNNLHRKMMTNGKRREKNCFQSEKTRQKGQNEKTTAANEMVLSNFVIL